MYLLYSERSLGASENPSGDGRVFAWYWCAGEDSNLHVPKDTGPSSLLGYQLRHPRVIVSTLSKTLPLCSRGIVFLKFLQTHSQFFADAFAGDFADIIKFGAADAGRLGENFNFFNNRGL